jgi:hypothetical protein
MAAPLHMGYAGTGEDANSISHNDLWQFDPSGGASLPLSILDFTGVYEEPSTFLHWQTTQEENTRLFNIQRSTNGKDFAVIGMVPAAGSSTAVIEYSYMDGGAAGARVPVLYYRLQELDLDGKPTFSLIVAVNISKLDKGIIVSPNPATDNITIQIGAGAAARAALIITDVGGRKVVGQDINLYTGNNSLPVAVGSLPAGVYYVIVKSSAQSWQTKFMKK